MRIYVGNLAYSTTEDTLSAEFGAHGTVDEVAVVTDRETGRPRGFAFVTMSSSEEGQAAIEAVNGREIDGRTVVVNEARPKSGGGGGGGGGGATKKVNCWIDPDKVSGKRRGRITANTSKTA